ncbi:MULTISPECIES: MFS transporter [unclassified Streptomyces]|uniref:MFS transporter n=1 Tax=unclassified Streptomyces TaxID=2593676 RepID=UPI002737F0FE|nr:MULTISPECIES: MFS transporter [unclassified Streptomyces]
MTMRQRGVDGRREPWKERIPGGRDGRRMLAVTWVDKTGNGLWNTTSALYFIHVAGLSLVEVGTLVSVAAAVGVAGAPLAGRFADRVPLVRLLVAFQLLRAGAAIALFLSDGFAALLVCAALGSFGDRSANVLTKLYAARVGGPQRVRYQAVVRTAANAGWAVGGLVAAAVLSLGVPHAYEALLVGDALSFAAAAALTLRCGEPPSPRVTVAGSGSGPAAYRPASPWRDRGYLAYVATDTVLYLHDSLFQVGLSLWTVHATDAPEGLVPLLTVLNSGMVVALQVPLSRLAAGSAACRRLLLPLAAVFTAGGLAMAASVADGPWLASAALLLAAAVFTVGEILHATVSWELSVALAPAGAQGAYVGVHGLAGSVQRSAGPLAVTAAIAAGPAGWALFGAVIGATCLVQYRLVRDRLAQSPPAGARDAAPSASTGS